MAEKKLNIRIGTKGARKAKKDIQDVDSRLKSLGKAALKAGATFWAAKGIVTGLFKLGETAGKAQALERGFTNLGKQIGFTKDSFNKLNIATDGTINSMELMKQANNAMLLGIVKSDDEMAKLFDTAQRLAQAVGQDARFGIESLVTGMGRQSRMMLDNLGIIVKSEKAYRDYAKEIDKSVSELTEAERKTAFMTAAMEAAETKVSSLGKEQLTMADSLAKMKVSSAEAAIALGEVLSPVIIGVASFLGGAAKLAGSFLDKLHELATVNSDAFDPDPVKALEEEIKLTKSLIEGMMPEVELEAKFAGGFGLATTYVKGLKEQLAEAEKELKELLKTQEEAPQKAEDDAFLAFVETQKKIVENYEQELVNIERLKVEYPHLAKALNMIGKEGKKNIEITKEQAIQYGIQAESALGGFRRIIKAKFASMIAGMLEKEIGTKGFFGLATGTIGAGLAMGLFESLVPKFHSGGLIGGDIPIIAQTGEFVLSREAVQSIGIDTARRINEGRGTGATINIYGGVVQDDYIRNELLPAINRAEELS